MSDAAKVPSANGGTGGLGFDPDALRAKYRGERDKRIRADANEQYVEVNGDFSRYVDDPCAREQTAEATADDHDL